MRIGGPSRGKGYAPSAGKMKCIIRLHNFLCLPQHATLYLHLHPCTYFVFETSSLRSNNSPKKKTFYRKSAAQARAIEGVVREIVRTKHLINDVEIIIAKKRDLFFSTHLYLRLALLAILLRLVKTVLLIDAVVLMDAVS